MTQRNRQYLVQRTSILITLSVIILFSWSQNIVAQQRDGDDTSAGSNSSGAPGRVNFNIIQLMNGEYLEMFGAGTSRGILRGHPSVPAIELGSLSADPLLFSTNSIERMRIMPNGFVGIGTSSPITALDLHIPANIAYSPNSTQPARIRLINSDATATLNNAFEIDLGSFDTAGIVSTGVRLAAIFTNHTTNGTSGDFAIGLRNGGPFFESARFSSNGRIGFGTSTPQDAFHVFNTAHTVGTIRLQGGNTYAGFMGMWDVGQQLLFTNNRHPGTGNNFNTAVAGAQLSLWGGDIAFATSSSGTVGTATELMRIKSSGNIGIGTAAPAYRLDVQGGAVNASGGLCIAGDCRTAWPTSSGSSQWTTIGPNINYAGGNVGINIDPVAKLEVSGFGPAGTAIFRGSGTFSVFNYTGNGTEDTYIRGGRTTSRVFINDDNSGDVLLGLGGGKVGIGTVPNAKLQVSGVGVAGTAVFGGTAFASHFNYNGDNTEDTYIRGGKSTSRVLINDLGTGNVLVAPGSGNVGIGTTTPTVKLHVTGDGKFTGSVTVDGNIAAKYQDVAEWVPAEEQLAAGTVVVLDTTKPNHVISSNTSYDTRVAGVISEQPGITLGEKSDNKVLVATTGRVKVKVDATNGPIQIGDLLVSSDREGFAMKSLPVEIGGSRMHRPGTLIGKALEPLAKGAGEILVLLSLQ